MQKKEKASAPTLADLSNLKCLTIDHSEADKYSQPSKYPDFVFPKKKCQLFSLPFWYYLREEIGANEAELLRDLDYWIRKNLALRKRPAVYWTYNKLHQRIRIPVRTLQRNVTELGKRKLITVMGSRPIWFMINYDELLELEKFLISKLAGYDANLAVFFEENSNH